MSTNAADSRLSRCSAAREATRSSRTAQEPEHELLRLNRQYTSYRCRFTGHSSSIGHSRTMDGAASWTLLLGRGGGGQCFFGVALRWRCARAWHPCCHCFGWMTGVWRCWCGWIACCAIVAHRGCNMDWIGNISKWTLWAVEMLGWESNCFVAHGGCGVSTWCPALPFGAHVAHAAHAGGGCTGQCLAADLDVMRRMPLGASSGMKTACERLACDVVMSAGGTAAAPSCQVHDCAGCWQAAPVSDPARAYRALARRTRQCSQLRWFQRGGASVGRRASEAVAARASQQPGVRAIRASARAFAPMLATALVSASRWWILSEAREASDGGDGPCWVIGGGGGVRRLRGRQAVASGDGGCTGWLRRAEQRCTSERQTRQCEWSVRAGGRCWPATAAASSMAAAAAAARATATCAVECGDNNGRGLAGAGRRRRRRLAAATRRRRRDGGDATAA